jgi:hypothetical protein
VTPQPFTVAAGAGFAGDRIDPAVRLAESGVVDAICLECLAERTLIAALQARSENREAGADPRLRRRLSPLLPAAQRNRCRIVSNLGAANPAAAGRAIADLAHELGCGELRVAAIDGDDVMARAADIEWQDPVGGRLIGAHAYIGSDGIAAAIGDGADVVVTGRAADSALFAGALIPQLDGSDEALAGALAVGHLLECSGQLTGGNYEPPGGGGLSAAELAQLGFPLARVAPDGSAEISVLDSDPGIVDRLTCTVQLLYEVHDPTAYITPDGVLDFSTIRFEEIGPRTVRMTSATMRPKPAQLKVIGFVERPGMIADVEIGYAGTGAQERAMRAADVLRERLRDWPEDEIRIDLVGINAILGGASRKAAAPPSELRVHVSANCPDMMSAQIVEDEVYALTLSGPSGGASVRSERRRRIETISGLIDRALAHTTVHWEKAA